jgi:hypothetical protein
VVHVGRGRGAKRGRRHGGAGVVVLCHSVAVGGWSTEVVGVGVGVAGLVGDDGDRVRAGVFTSERGELGKG